MLVLNLKVGERIMIADGEIIVEAVEFRPSGVRLGITAPKDIVVDREVTHEKRQRAKVENAVA